MEVILIDMRGTGVQASLASLARWQQEGHKITHLVLYDSSIKSMGNRVNVWQRGSGEQQGQSLTAWLEDHGSSRTQQASFQQALDLLLQWWPKPPKQPVQGAIFANTWYVPYECGVSSIPGGQGQGHGKPATPAEAAMQALYKQATIQFKAEFLPRMAEMFPWFRSGNMTTIAGAGTAALGSLLLQLTEVKQCVSISVVQTGHPQQDDDGLRDLFAALGPPDTGRVLQRCSPSFDLDTTPQAVEELMASPSPSASASPWASLLPSPAGSLGLAGLLDSPPPGSARQSSAILEKLPLSSPGSSESIGGLLLSPAGGFSSLLDGVGTPEAMLGCPPSTGKQPPASPPVPPSGVRPRELFPQKQKAVGCHAPELVVLQATGGGVRMQPRPGNPRAVTQLVPVEMVKLNSSRRRPAMSPATAERPNKVSKVSSKEQPVSPVALPMYVEAGLRAKDPDALQLNLQLPNGQGHTVPLRLRGPDELVQKLRLAKADGQVVRCSCSPYSEALDGGSNKQSLGARVDWDWGSAMKDAGKLAMQQADRKVVLVGAAAGVALRVVVDGSIGLISLYLMRDEPRVTLRLLGEAGTERGRGRGRGVAAA